MGEEKKSMKNSFSADRAIACPFAEIECTCDKAKLNFFLAMKS